jgi:hypothetical protein
MSTASDPNRTTPDHAPLPWHVGPHYHTDIYSRNGFVAECRPMNAPQPLANAEFIVRACNTHDDLVGALKFVLAFYEPDAGEYLDTEAWKRAHAQAKAAIAKAEGR